MFCGNVFLLFFSDILSDFVVFCLSSDMYVFFLNQLLCVI